MALKSLGLIPASTIYYLTTMANSYHSCFTWKNVVLNPCYIHFKISWFCEEKHPNLLLLFSLKVSMCWTTLPKIIIIIMCRQRPCKYITLGPVDNFWTEPKALKMEGYNWNVSKHNFYNSSWCCWNIKYTC